ncbi:hypothetical protein AHF37_00375 [Paragonimus kellicotti]|nr:hypothetical protein AHF37_00375 [Paragonimus kellicotti]
MSADVDGAKTALHGLLDQVCNLRASSEDAMLERGCVGGNLRDALSELVRARLDSVTVERDGALRAVDEFAMRVSVMSISDIDAAISAAALSQCPFQSRVTVRAGSTACC